MYRKENKAKSNKNRAVSKINRPKIIDNRCCVGIVDNRGVVPAQKRMENQFRHHVTTPSERTIPLSKAVNRNVAQLRPGDDLLINAFRIARNWQGNEWDWLFAGFDNTMNDGAVLGQLLNNFSNRTGWTYSGRPREQWNGNNNGDCNTLSNEFKDIVVNCFGIAATVNNLGNDIFVVAGGAILGTNRTGNVDNGAHWFFNDHFVVTAGGNTYDILFGIPNLHPNSVVAEWIGGEQFTAGGTTYKRRPIELRTPTNQYATVQQSQKCCFITSACVETMGLNDDCEELTVLRIFRDGYMKTIDGGNQMIEEYYDVAPKIVEAINDLPDRKYVYVRLYKNIKYCVDLIKKGQLDSALSIYKKMVLSLMETY